MASVGRPCMYTLKGLRHLVEVPALQRLKPEDHKFKVNFVDCAASSNLA